MIKKTKTKKAIDINNRYIDRDIDWIAFNLRVFQEAEDETTPLFERIKFLGILSSNFDEFFKVRVSKLRQLKTLDKSIRKPLGLRPNKILKQIFKEIKILQKNAEILFSEKILPKLNESGIELLVSIDNNNKSFAYEFFKKELQPLIQIISTEKVSSNALIDQSLYVMVSFEENDDLAFLTIPMNFFGRFVIINSNDKSIQYAFIEDIIKEFSQDFFTAKVASSHCIKMSKDAELYLNDDYEGDWINQIHESLIKRQEGQPTKFLFDKGMSKDTQKKVRKILNIGIVDMIEGNTHINFSDFFSFPFPIKKQEHFYEPLTPVLEKNFVKYDDIFQLIKEKDRILHFPYHSFENLEKWLEQASNDKNVISISISLYRIAKNSTLTNALVKALENNIKVSVFVEANARFDEENNLYWGKFLEEKGAAVFYSFRNIKVHSKILLIKRKENNKVQDYAFIGTGNFNAKTAKIYTDHGLFTANNVITSDLNQVFKVLKREVVKPKITTLVVSPFNTRTTFKELIQQEIDNAVLGLPSGITLKMNSLEDKEMIDYLYVASKVGVKIKLLVRGFCCLVPGIKGLSENIEVTSIVDRFLEHSRIFLFNNNDNEKMFIGSADLMIRNLDKRIEVITPILDKDVFNELKNILNLQLSDNVKARKRNINEDNKYVSSKKQTEIIRSQYAIYEYVKKLNQ